MTSPWVSAIFCLLSDCRVGQIPGAHPGYGAIPIKDALVRAPCIDLMAAVESLDRILAGLMAGFRATESQGSVE